MNAERLLEHFDRISEAPDAVPRLRQFALKLALQGEFTSKKQQSWTHLTLGDLGVWGSGGTPNKSHPEFYGGDIPWLVIGDLDDGVVKEAATYITQEGLQNSSAKILEPNTLLVAMYGSIGKLGITGMRCATNQAIAFCVPDEEKVSLRFLFFALMAMRDSLAAKGQGVAQQNISQKILKEIQIDAPPIPEQHQIVAKADELIALCDELESIKEKREKRHDRLVAATLHHLNNGDEGGRTEGGRSFLENARFYLNHLPKMTTKPEHVQQLRQTILNLAVRGKLVRQDPGDEPAGEIIRRIRCEKLRLSPQRGTKVAESRQKLHDASHPYSIPAQWEWVILDDITDIGTGSTPSRTTSEFWQDGKVPWVTSGLTSQSVIMGTSEFITEHALKRCGLRVYKPGTLLVALYGQGRTRGQVASLGIDATINQACAAISPINGFEAMQDYLRILFEKNYEQIRALSAGGAQPNLNVQKVKEVFVPLPPLLEQSRIVAKVDELFELCDGLEKRLKAGVSIRNSLLEATLQEALA